MIGGAAVFADDALRREVWSRTVELGASADPFAAWLTLRFRLTAVASLSCFLAAAGS